MELGDRVEIVDGLLKGERATIIVNPWNEWKRKSAGGKDEVCLQFDRRNARCGREQGYAILSDQWMEAEDLRVIE